MSQTYSEYNKYIRIMSCQDMCYGCLCNDRKITKINEYWKEQAFLQILNEYAVNIADISKILLCWECDALLCRFTRYKLQVKNSVAALNNVLNDYITRPQNSHRFKISHETNINILPLDNSVIDLDKAPNNKAIKQEDKEICKDNNDDIKTEELVEENNMHNFCEAPLTDFSELDENGDGCKVDLIRHDGDEDIFLINLASKNKNKKQKLVTNSKKKKVKKKQIADRADLPLDNSDIDLAKASNNKAIKQEDKEICNDNNDDIKPEELVEENNMHNFCEAPLTDLSELDENGDGCKVDLIRHDGDEDIFLINLASKNKNKKQKLVTNSKKKKVKKKQIADKADLKKEPFYKEVELSYDEVLEERRLLALSDELVNAVYKCEKCILTFPNADDFRDHEAVKHVSDSPYICHYCERSFITEFSYKYHMRKHRLRYKCTFCTLMFVSKRDASKHYETTHHGSAGDYNMDVDELVRHTTKVEDESKKQDQQVFPCELCAKTFRWKTSLRKHLETHSIEKGQKRKPYCEICRLVFTTSSNLQKHVKTSSKHRVLLRLRKLNESNMEDTPNPDKHQARIDQIKCSVAKENQNYPCPQCDKKFQWKGNLWRHLQSHTAKANGELICVPCNKTFASIATYNQHMQSSRKHITENDFKYMCNECGTRFVNKTRLIDHVNWEHLKKFVHSCSVCHKVFKSHTSLYLHNQVVHKKYKDEHLCDHCGKPFPNQTKLRAHIVALHSVDSPFKCLVCSAKFSWHSCLSRHIKRVHHQNSSKKSSGSKAIS